MSDKDLIIKYVEPKKQKKALKKLSEGYPVQYLIGNVEFYDTTIFVNKNVLIPRFETEYLVEKTINRLKKYHINNPNILDLCTGSGCIAISIKTHILSSIDALDISSKSIKIAKKNAKYNDVDINFVVSDLENFEPDKKYNLIIANPPYVDIAKEIDPKTKYEPALALYAPLNGLYFYEIILKKYQRYLEDRYLLAFEIGEEQAKEISNIAKKYYKNAKIMVEKDLCGKDRYLFITNCE